MSTQVEVTRPTPSTRSAVVNWKYLFLSLLIASRWVVYGFTDVALTAVLRKSGVSLTQIGLMHGVGFLFMFKFLWAPLVDRIALFGRPGYKPWFLAMQLALALALLVLLPMHPAQDFYLVLGFLVLASILATFRDIAIDGLAVKLLTPEERAAANGWMSAGFMLGMVAGGGLLLVAYDSIGWQGAIWALVLGSLIPIPVVWLFKEPQQGASPAQQLAAAPMWSALRDFFRVTGNLQWAGLIVLQTWSGIAGTSLIAVMLIDNGWTLARLGTVVNIIGPLVAAGMSLAAGLVFARLSRRAALVSMMLVGAAFSFVKIPIAHDAYAAWLTVAVVIASVVVATLTNVAQKTIVMDKASCTSDYGSNFTLQASLAQIGGIFSMMAAPMLSQWLGYPAVLALGGVLGLISAVLLMRYRHL